MRKQNEDNPQMEEVSNESRSEQTVLCQIRQRKGKKKKRLTGNNVGIAVLALVFGAMTVIPGHITASPDRLQNTR